MSEFASRDAKDFVGAVRETIRDNPVPAALVGMGLIWLMAGGGRSSARAGVGMAADSLSAIGAKAADGAKSLGGAIADRAAAAADSARVGLSVGNMQSTLGSLLEEQPLLLGAVGLAIGAGVAASLPMTQIENDYLAEASADFQSKARLLAADQIERAKGAAQAAKTAVVDEARAQGLTAEEMKAAATEMQQKVKDLAGYAGKAVQEKLH